MQLKCGLLSHFPSYIAADLGAGSGRVVAGQLVNEQLCLHEVTRFSTSFSEHPGSEYLSWGIVSIEEHVRQGIELAAMLAPVVSVGVDSWGVDYVLLDAELRRVGTAICYRDNRTLGMIGRVTARIPASDIYRRTGIQFQAFNTLYQLAAMADQEPAWNQKTRHLLMIPDYLHFRLSGVLSNEYTNATTTQCLNLNGQWDIGLLEAAGAHRGWLQPPVQAGTVLGEMQFGDTAAKVVTPASHDTASAVVGTPFESAGEAFISSGTWSLMGIESMDPLASEEARLMNFSNEGGFERRFRVLKNIMGLWLVQRLSQEFQTTIDDALLQAAEAAKPWRSILNPDDARFLNPPSMTQAIRDFCRETRQPVPESLGEFSRCAFESLALSYRLVKEQLESLRGTCLTGIRIVGGGSRNRFLNQLCADACQLPVSAGPVEASALGNICAQMIALRELDSLSQARELIRRSFAIGKYRPHEPIPANVWAQFQEYTATRTLEDVS